MLKQGNLEHSQVQFECITDSFRIVPGKVLNLYSSFNWFVFVIEKLHIPILAFKNPNSEIIKAYLKNLINHGILFEEFIDAKKLQSF